MAIERARTTTSTLPPHMVSLGGADWSAWRWAVLRGAGFPAALVRTFAAPEAAHAADALLRAEDDEARAQRAALDARRLALQGDAGDRVALNRIKKDVFRGRAIDAASIADPTVRAAVETYNGAIGRAQAARDAYSRAYSGADDTLDRVIYDLASSSRFCEAVIWQNRHAYRRAIGPLHAAAVSRPPLRANHRRLVANYVQRYCVKNDTIGFFGPVAWIRLSPDRTSLSLRPGANLLAMRSVFFETWCIDELCNVLSQNPLLLQWIEPRPGYLRLNRDAMRVFQFTTPEAIQLDATQMTVLLACDGERIAARVVDDLMASEPSLFPNEASVYEQLATLRQLGAIVWRLSVPDGPHPERDLQEQLQRIGDDRLRAEALGVVAALEEERARVVASAGHPDALDRALDHLEDTFTRVTGAAATRRGGETYAGRTLVYEDCRRDLDVEIGADLLEELGRPLSLLLTSARWLSYELIRRYRPALEEAYAGLAERLGSSRVDGGLFWAAIRPIMRLKDNALLDGLAAAYGQGWRDILTPLIAAQRDDDGETRRVVLRSEDVRGRVEERFGAPGPGWELARYHSPDIMIAADGPDAIRRGDYAFVLGEFHIAKNTLDSVTFLDQHPSRHEIADALMIDLRQPRVIVPRLRGRGSRTCDLPTDYWLETENRSGCAPSQMLPLTRLGVERQDGALVARSLDGRFSLDLVDFLGCELGYIIVDAFKTIFDGMRHVPRLTIDRLVVQRERWSFPVSELAWATEKDDAARFLAARRWTREQRMPRFVFVKSVVEAKPFYVDFDSPIYVTILAKTIARTIERHPAGADIVLTEMLPTHDQMWMTDADGRRYASELRVAVYDRADVYVPEGDREIAAMS